ncbi:hypothetical protein BKA64DRAFT_722565 [Cadophora sp. MPI-SDFR-AT-0126]|nr:hypothetical protein BKA64DRAFT_722565 [Leotiomycetes sp. MPI-SDFR-AT-0126]
MRWYAAILSLSGLAVPAIAQNCRNSAASSAPPNGATKLTLPPVIGDVVPYNGNGCSLTFTRVGALPEGSCNAEVRGVGTCSSNHTIFVSDTSGGTWRAFKGGADTRPMCYSNIYSCQQGIFVQESSADNGGGGGTPIPPPPPPPGPAPGPPTPPGGGGDNGDNNGGNNQGNNGGTTTTQTLSTQPAATTTTQTLSTQPAATTTLTTTKAPSQPTAAPNDCTPFASDGSCPVDICDECCSNDDGCS